MSTIIPRWLSTLACLALCSCATTEPPPGSNYSQHPADEKPAEDYPAWTYAASVAAKIANMFF